MRPRLLPILLVRLLYLLQVFQQEAPRLLVAAGYGPQPQRGDGCGPTRKVLLLEVGDGPTRTQPPPPIAARFEAAAGVAFGRERRVATRAGGSSFRGPYWRRCASKFQRSHARSSSFGPGRSPTALRPGRGAAVAAAESLRLVLATSRGGGGSGGGFSHRTNTRNAPGRGGKRTHVVNDDTEGFGWDDAREVLRSVSTRGQNAWNHRVRPFLQHRVVPALKDPGGWFGADSSESSSGASSQPPPPVGRTPPRYGASRRVAVHLGQVQHFVLLSVAGCVVGDVLPSPSSAVDFDFVLDISSSTKRRRSHDRDDDDEAVSAGFVEWWNSVLRQPKTFWNPLSKASPTVQRIVGSVMGLLASQLVQPIVPALVRVAIVAMVAGEANSFLCDQYGENWYETHANENVDHWLRHLDDALERWRQIVRSALQDPATSYRRLRRTVDAQLQQEMAIPTHVANGMIGGVVVGLAVA